MGILVEELIVGVGMAEGVLKVGNGEPLVQRFRNGSRPSPRV